MKRSLAYRMGQHWRLTAAAAAVALTATIWAIATAEPDKPEPPTYNVLTAPPTGRDVSTPSLSEGDARVMCKMAFQHIAKDRDKAEIPFVSQVGSDPGEYFFAWGPNTKHMRMRNGLGLDVAATGSCIVSKQTRRISSLTLNGQRIL